MNLIDVHGGRYSPLTTPTGRLLWVDQEKGNDSLGRRSFMTVPFATLKAAKEAAASGDAIIVLPGSYAVSEQLAKNGVNWHFLNEVYVAPLSGLATAIFEVGSAMSFAVTGHARFDTGTAAVLVLNVTSNAAGSNVHFEARSVMTEKSAVKVGAAAVVVVKLDSILSDESCIDVSNGTVSVAVREMTSASGHGVYCTGGSLNVDAYQVKSTGGKGIYFTGGTARIRAMEVLSTAGPAVEYNNGSSAVLMISNARLKSELASASGRAVYIASSSNALN